MKKERKEKELMLLQQDTKMKFTKLDKGELGGEKGDKGEKVSGDPQQGKE